MLKFLKKNKIYFKFLISGITATVSDLFFLYIFHGILQISLFISILGAYLISFLISFTLQKRWTFAETSNEHESDNNANKQISLYFTITIINIALNSFFVQLLVAHQKIILSSFLYELIVIKFNIWYLIAQAMISAILGIESFLVYRYIIFRKKKKLKKEILG